MRTGAPCASRLFVPCYVDQLWPARRAAATRRAARARRLRGRVPRGADLLRPAAPDRRRPRRRRARSRGAGSTCSSATSTSSRPPASCVAMVRRHYARAARRRRRARRARRACTSSASSWSTCSASSALPGRFPHRVGLHPSCHGAARAAARHGRSERSARRADDPARAAARRARRDRARRARAARRVLRLRRRVRGRPRRRSRAGWAATALARHRDAGAEVLTSTDASCLAAPRGARARAAGSPLRVLHVAEILAGRGCRVSGPSRARRRAFLARRRARALARRGALVRAREARPRRARAARVGGAARARRGDQAPHARRTSPYYLEQFEAARDRARRARPLGARRRRAQRDRARACCAARGVTRVVKSKSMLTEECGLNALPRGARHRGRRHRPRRAHRAAAPRAAEPHRDARDPPASATRSARCSTRELGSAGRARRSGRAHRGRARAPAREVPRARRPGITGVNFAIAETGGIVVCTNEGNADLGTALPPLHIACMGIEKLIPRAARPRRLPAPARALGHGPGDHRLHVALPRPARRAASCTSCSSTTGAAALLADRSLPPRARVHPLRRVHEHVPGLPPQRRPQLRRDRPGPDRLGARAGARSGAPREPAVRVQPVRLVHATSARCGSTCHQQLLAWRGELAARGTPAARAAPLAAARPRARCSRARALYRGRGRARARGRSACLPERWLDRAGRRLDARARAARAAARELPRRVEAAAWALVATRSSPRSRRTRSRAGPDRRASRARRCTSPTSSRRSGDALARGRRLRSSTFPDRAALDRALADAPSPTPIVIAGGPAVAESGAVWWVPRDEPERRAAFLAEHVVLVVARDAARRRSPRRLCADRSRRGALRLLRRGPVEDRGHRAGARDRRARPARARRVSVGLIDPPPRGTGGEAAASVRHDKADMQDTLDRVSSSDTQLPDVAPVLRGVPRAAAPDPDFDDRHRVSERQSRRDEAVAEVSSKWGNAQVLTGPVLVVPYTHRWISPNKKGEPVTRSEPRDAIFLPERLHTRGRSSRRRGTAESSRSPSTGSTSPWKASSRVPSSRSSASSRQRWTGSARTSRSASPTCARSSTRARCRGTARTCLSCPAPEPIRMAVRAFTRESAFRTGDPARVLVPARAERKPRDLVRAVRPDHGGGARVELSPPELPGQLAAHRTDASRMRRSRRSGRSRSWVGTFRRRGSVDR